MKLNKLHIANPTAGAPGHRNTVSGRRIRITGIAIDLPQTPGSQDDGFGQDSLNTIIFYIKCIGTVAAIRFVFSDGL